MLRAHVIHVRMYHYVCMIDTGGQPGHCGVTCIPVCIGKMLSIFRSFEVDNLTLKPLSVTIVVFNWRNSRLNCSYCERNMCLKTKIFKCLVSN